MSMNSVSRPTAADRLPVIEQARQSVLGQAVSVAQPGIEPWITRSWQRCLASGQRPEQRVAFEAVSRQSIRRIQDASQTLLQTARPVLDKLARAMADTRYFAILTDAQGVVVEVNGPIDRQDRRADVLARVGVDLSERAVGTTAIGAALAELQPVWLHRGEHFFEDTSVYSCAGAPLFGPDGQCAGMLDLTGVDTVERPELRHLVVQSARSIENALTQSRPHHLLIRLSWTSQGLGDDADGLVCLDTDGWVTGANPAARQMLGQLRAGPAAVHCSELFAMPHPTLFDAAQPDTLGYAQSIEVPLWSGLRLHAVALRPSRSGALPRMGVRPAPAPHLPLLPLKDVETALIRKAVREARGNVMQAAKALGISRATVYRRLGSTKPK